MTDPVMPLLRRVMPWTRVRDLAALVVVLGALTTMCVHVQTVTSQVETKPHADSTYVTKADYTVHISDERLLHLKDSLETEVRDTRTDTLLNELVRDCRRRGGCQ
jgi:hypothetical protein